jgi:hypothetical protein
MQGTAIYPGVAKDEVASALKEEVPVDAKEMARQLGCAASSVGRMGAAGIIPSVLLGVREGARRYYPRQVKHALMDRSQGRLVESKRRCRKAEGNDEV